MEGQHGEQLFGSHHEQVTVHIPARLGRSVKRANKLAAALLVAV